MPSWRFQQPAHRLVDLIAGHVRDAQVRAEGDVIPPRQRRQLGLRRHHPGDDQGVGQVPFPAGRAEQPGQAQLPGGGVHQGDVTVRAGPGDAQRGSRVDQGPALQHRLDRGGGER